MNWLKSFFSFGWLNGVPTPPEPTPEQRVLAVVELMLTTEQDAWEIGKSNMIHRARGVRIVYSKGGRYFCDSVAVHGTLLSMATSDKKRIDDLVNELIAFRQITSMGDGKPYISTNIEPLKTPVPALTMNEDYKTEKRERYKEEKALSIAEIKDLAGIRRDLESEPEPKSMFETARCWHCQQSPCGYNCQEYYEENGVDFQELTRTYNPKGFNFQEFTQTQYVKGFNPDQAAVIAAMAKAAEDDDGGSL